jgi:hypothetical protein
MRHRRRSTGRRDGREAIGARIQNRHKPAYKRYCSNALHPCEKRPTAYACRSILFPLRGTIRLLIRLLIVIITVRSVPERVDLRLEPGVVPGHSVVVVNNAAVPFNVQTLDGKVVVTFVPGNAVGGFVQNAAGREFVDEFNTDGSLVGRVANIGTLNDPWRPAIAPSTFGQFAGDLLVGNSGNGTIDAFNLATGAPIGTPDDASGNAIILPDYGTRQSETAPAVEAG